MQGFTQRLGAAIDKLGSPTEVAQALNCSPRTVRNWLEGKNSPRVDDVYRIEQLCAARDIDCRVYEHPPVQQRLGQW